MVDVRKSDTLVGGYQAPALPVVRRAVSSLQMTSSTTGIPTRSIRYARRTKDELDRCVFLEFDPQKQRWIDRLRQPRRDLPAAPSRATPNATTSEHAVLAHPQLLTIGLFLMFLPPVGVLMTWATADIPVTGKKGITWLGALVLLLQATLVAASWLHFH